MCTVSFRWPPPSSMHRCTRVKKLRITAWSVSRAMSGVRTEDGRPGGFLRATEPSSRHCLTRRRIAFADGASCWFRSRRNPRRVSVIDLVRINSSTAHTHTHTHTHHTHTHTHTLSLSLLLPSAPCWLNLKVAAYAQIVALRDTLAEKHVTKILKCFTICGAHCICSLRCPACNAHAHAHYCDLWSVWLATFYHKLQDFRKKNTDRFTRTG